MTTARDIIKRAMQKVGILTKTEDPSADEANDGLTALNAMLSSWSNESMLISARVLENFPLVGGVGSYTIGPSMVFNTVRPIKIVSSYVRLVGSVTDTNVGIINDEDYDAITAPNIQGIPEFLNYSNGYPTGTIKLFPVPSTSYTLFIRSEKILSQFVLDDIVDLPPGWERALIYNLGLELHADYPEIEIPSTTIGIANDSKAAIQRAIMRVRSFDAFPQGNFNSHNIYTGWNW